MTNIPKPLFSKLLFTILIGTGFLLFGAVYHFCFSPDKVFLYMSLFVFTASRFKGGLLFNKLKNGNYEVVEGICVGLSSKPFSKLRNVKFIDAEGIEATVRIPKNHKFQIERKYRLYFSKQPAVSVGSDFIDSRLAADSFLGYEEIE